MNNNNIFIGTYGNVACICQHSGKELWRTALPGCGFSPVTVYFEDGRVYCGSNGKVFFLCATTGTIIAKNELEGQGFGIITFTTKRSETGQQQSQQQPQQQSQPQIIQQPPMQQFYSDQPPTMVQSIGLNQPMFYPQPNQLQYPPQIYPQFSLIQEDEKRNDLNQSDEEYARLIDNELNGDRRRNNNVNVNNVFQNQPVPIQMMNFVQPTQVLSIDDIVFVGLNSFISALNKHTAQMIWRAYIPTSYGMPLSIIYTKGKINVASLGHIYCLNALNGREMWRNNLPGLRYGNVSIVSTTNNNTFYNSNSPLVYSSQN